MYIKGEHLLFCYGHVDILNRAQLALSNYPDLSFLHAFFLSFKTNAIA